MGFGTNIASCQTCPLTVHGSVVSVGVDPLVGQDLDVLAAGAAVQLVGSGQPAAHPVRHAALLGNMVLEIRRRLHRALSDNTGNTRQEILNDMRFNFRLKALKLTVRVKLAKAASAKPFVIIK